MRKIEVKSQSEVDIMTEGGKKLALVKNALRDAVKVGVSALEIEDLACELIKKEGAKESFKMVPGYRWATCINVNDGVVHGIPKKELVFKRGDLVSIDVGLYYKGYHLDTSTSVDLNGTSEVKRFLTGGKAALKAGIKAAKPGSRIFDVSEAIEQTLKGYGFNSVRGLVGHGIGKNLHEFPQIPCTTLGMLREASEEISVGNTLAIEVMYSTGSGEIVLDKDGWTIKARDGKLTGLFEDTIAVGVKGPTILTDI